MGLSRAHKRLAPRRATSLKRVKELETTPGSSQEWYVIFTKRNVCPFRGRAAKFSGGAFLEQESLNLWGEGGHWEESEAQSFCHSKRLACVPKITVGNKKRG